MAEEISKKWIHKLTPKERLSNDVILPVIRKDKHGKLTYSQEEQSLYDNYDIGVALRRLKQMNIPINAETISYLLPIFTQEGGRHFQLQKETVDPILHNTPTGRQVRDMQDSYDFPVYEENYMAPLIIQDKLKEYKDIMYYNGKGKGTSTYAADKGARYDALLWKKNVEMLRKKMQTDPMGRDAYSMMMTGMSGKDMQEDPRYVARQIGRVGYGLPPARYDKEPWENTDPFGTLLQQWTGR